MNDKVPFKLMLPTEVKRWIEAESAKNFRSQGAEIVACLRARMDAMEKADA